METLFRPAVERLLGGWIHSLSKDQLKFTRGFGGVKLAGLRVREDAIHAVLGLPPSLIVRRAYIKELEVEFPKLATFTSDPIVVRVSHLEVTVARRLPRDPPPPDPAAANQEAKQSPGTVYNSTNGYSLTDKLADGATLMIGSVSILLDMEPPADKSGKVPNVQLRAKVTIKNIISTATNEHWQEADLEKVRAFCASRRSLFTFRKVQWDTATLHTLVKTSEGSITGFPVIQGLAGCAKLVLERKWGSMWRLAAEVDVDLWDAICAPLSGDTFSALVGLASSIQSCFTLPPPKKGARAPVVQAGCGQPLTMYMVKLANLLVRVREKSYEYEFLMQGISFWLVQAPLCAHDYLISRVSVDFMFMRDPSSSPPCTYIQPAAVVPSPERARQPPVPVFARQAFLRVHPLKQDPEGGGGSIEPSTGTARAMLRVYACGRGAWSPTASAEKTLGSNVVMVDQIEMEVMAASITSLGALIAHVRDTLANRKILVDGAEAETMVAGFDIHLMGALVTFPLRRSEPDTAPTAAAEGDGEEEGAALAPQKPAEWKGVKLQMLVQDVRVIVDPTLKFQKLKLAPAEDVFKVARMVLVVGHVHCSVAGGGARMKADSFEMLRLHMELSQDNQDRETNQIDLSSSVDGLRSDACMETFMLFPQIQAEGRACFSALRTAALHHNADLMCDTAPTSVRSLDLSLKWLEVGVKPSSADEAHGAENLRLRCIALRLAAERTVAAATAELGAGTVTVEHTPCTPEANKFPDDTAPWASILRLERPKDDTAATAAGAMDIRLRVPLAPALGSDHDCASREGEGAQETALPANLKVHMVGLQLRGGLHTLKEITPQIMMEVPTRPPPSPAAIATPSAVESATAALGQLSRGSFSHAASVIKAATVDVHLADWDLCWQSPEQEDGEVERGGDNIDHVAISLKLKRGEVAVLPPPEQPLRRDVDISVCAFEYGMDAVGAGGKAASRSRKRFNSQLTAHHDLQAGTFRVRRVHLFGDRNDDGAAATAAAAAAPDTFGGEADVPETPELSAATATIAQEEAETTETAPPAEAATEGVASGKWELLVEDEDQMLLHLQKLALREYAVLRQLGAVVVHMLSPHASVDATAAAAAGAGEALPAAASVARVGKEGSVERTLSVDVGALEQVVLQLQKTQESLAALTKQVHSAGTVGEGSKALDESMFGVPIKGTLLRKQQVAPYDWEVCWIVVSWGLAILFKSDDLQAAPERMLRLTGHVDIATLAVDKTNSNSKEFSFVLTIDILYEQDGIQKQEQFIFAAKSAEDHDRWVKALRVSSTTPQVMLTRDMQLTKMLQAVKTREAFADEATDVAALALTVTVQAQAMLDQLKKQ